MYIWINLFWPDRIYICSCMSVYVDMHHSINSVFFHSIVHCCSDSSFYHQLQSVVLFVASIQLSLHCPSICPSIFNVYCCPQNGCLFWRSSGKHFLFFSSVQPQKGCWIFNTCISITFTWIELSWANFFYWLLC